MTPEGVAAFDFDGTITRSDSLVPFLLRSGAARAAAATLASAMSLPGAASDRRDRVKAAMLRRVYRGASAPAVAADGAAYAATLPGRYRREMLERIEWHRTEGHVLVLVTASLGFYARPAADALGFDQVIAVELEETAGVLTGEMAGPNVRAGEKAVRLRRLLDELELAADTTVWAYGNSAGDTELLAMADHPTWVGGNSARNGPGGP